MANVPCTLMPLTAGFQALACASSVMRG